MVNENKYGIERLEGRGITGVITDTGCRYSTYERFAVASGYPEAVGHRNQLPNGSEVEVLAKGKHEINGRTIYVVQHGDTRHLIGERGIKITEANHEMTNEIIARYEKAVEAARKAIEELRLASYAIGYEDARRDLTAVAPIVKLAVQSPQQLRDEVIEKAKRDVAEIIHDAESRFRVNRGNSVMRHYTNRVKIIVNNEKRTVVALVYGKHESAYNELRAKGIAKCTPSDCFNVHIGKAIALRRALGLEVPAEYLNAPQPTEVRVGDVVVIYGYDGKEIGPLTVKTFDCDGWLMFDDGGCSPFESGDKIIDDSREQ